MRRHRIWHLTKEKHSDRR